MSLLETFQRLVGKMYLVQQIVSYALRVTKWGGYKYNTEVLWNLSAHRLERPFLVSFVKHRVRNPTTGAEQWTLTQSMATWQFQIADRKYSTMLL